MPFLVSDGEEVLESDSAGTLRDGVVMNGRIGNPGETDSYTLKVQGGDPWAFELRSGELPGSSLYGVMTIASKDEVIAVAGKHAGDPNPYIITTTGLTATYPFVNLTVPPGVDELTVSVEDLLERGGQDFAYRLLARRQGPDFLLTLTEPYLNIPRGGSAIVNVIAERRGYYGPIELYVEDAPSDLEVSGGHIAPTSTLGNTLPRFETGRLTISAKTEASARRLNLVIRGRAVEKGNEQLDRRAAGPGVRVSVGGENQPAVTAEWLGYDLPARINPEQPASLVFETPRILRLVRGGGGIVAKWSYKPLQQGVKLKNKIDPPRNVASLRLRSIGERDTTESGEFRMFTHERSSLGMVNYNLSATVTFGGRDHVILSKPLEIDVVDGYKLHAPESPLVIAPGSQATWRGSIWRDPEFKRIVKVSATGLPPEVVCKEAELAGDQAGYELKCTSATDIAAGDFQVEIRAESVLSDEGTTKYIVDPVNAQLTVRQ